MKYLVSRGFREEKKLFTYFCFKFEAEILTRGAPLEEEVVVQKSGRSEHWKTVNWWLEATAVWKLPAAGSRSFRPVLGVRLVGLEQEHLGFSVNMKFRPWTEENPAKNQEK